MAKENGKIRSISKFSISREQSWIGLVNIIHAANTKAAVYHAYMSSPDLVNEQTYTAANEVASQLASGYYALGIFQFAVAGLCTFVTYDLSKDKKEI